MNTFDTIRDLLKAEEIVLLLDTVKYGCWGTCETEFLDENGNIEMAGSWVYITNDAKEGGHFSGRKVSAMFRSIYRRLCPYNGIVGQYLSHCHDWWGDNSGDVIFIREDIGNRLNEIVEK